MTEDITAVIRIHKDTESSATHRCSISNFYVWFFLPVLLMTWSRKALLIHLYHSKFWKGWPAWLPMRITVERCLINDMLTTCTGPVRLWFYSSYYLNIYLSLSHAKKNSAGCKHVDWGWPYSQHGSHSVHCFWHISLNLRHEMEEKLN